MMVLLLAVLALVLAGGAVAHAGFIVAAVAGAAFAATTAGLITSAIVGVAVSFGISYVASWLLNRNTEQQQAATLDVGGTELDIRMDAEIPQSLIVGRAVTAGSLVYAKTAGARGEIDNSDLVEVIALADHPCAALGAVWVDGQLRASTDTGTNRGFTVDGYDDNLAYYFFDGRQTNVDGFAYSFLGAEANNPYSIDAIGTGITYVRTHSIYNREKVPGRLRWRFLVWGIHLYDPRKDSTVGGVGAHRWGNEATYEWTENVATIVYNMLRGIYVKNAAGVMTFFYGLEGTAAAQLPLDNWFAAMNECDVVVDAGDTSEAQFTAGGEISLNTEPLEAIKALLKASGGRLTERGGIYKLYVGAPTVPTLIFSDGSLLANREESFKPNLSLERRINTITGTYISPADNWLPKVAPPRSWAPWEEEDGRRLPADLNAPMVKSGTQMQRVMQQLLMRSRQQRKHIVTLPPEAMAVEPGEIVQWSSDRNGYIDKLFEVDGVEYESNLCVTLALTEVDPADYDWSTDEEIDEVDGGLITVRPAARVVGGFSAEGFIYYGDENDQRPAIRLTWDPPNDEDCAGIFYQYRRAAAIDDVASGQVGADEVSAGQLILLGGLQSVTEYEVRAKYLSHNAYEASWSLWIPVTTPDARIGLSDFGEGLSDYVTREFARTQARVDAIDEIIAQRAAEQDAQNLLDRFHGRGDLHETRTVFNQEIAGAQASIEEVRQAGVAQGEAFAAYSVTVNAKIGEPGSENGTLQATITQNYQVFVSFEQGAFAQLVSNVETKIGEPGAAGSIQASVNEVRSAVADVDGAVASVRNTVSARVWNENGTAEIQASVAVQSVAIANINGTMAASWSVSINASGYMSGIRLMSDGTTSAFILSADTFQVAFPGVQGPTTVFQIANVNGVARMAFRGDFYADGSIFARAIYVGSLSALSVNFGDAVFSGVIRSQSNKLIINATENYILLLD